MNRVVTSAIQILGGKVHRTPYLFCLGHRLKTGPHGIIQELTDTSKQPIRTRYSGHGTVYHPIMDQYFLIRSVPDVGLTRDSNDQVASAFSTLTTNQNSLFMSCDWLSANQGPVFPDSVGSYEKSNLFSWRRRKGALLRPIRTRYLCHVTGYQPIRDQYFLIRSVPDVGLTRDSNDQVASAFSTLTTNQNSLFMSCDWLSANQGPVFPDSVGSFGGGEREVFRSRDWLSSNQGPVFPYSDVGLTRDSNDQVASAFSTLTTNQNSLFMSCDWLSANQGPVFPDSVGSCYLPLETRGRMTAESLW
eukprot:sb/3467279/